MAGLTLFVCKGAGHMRGALACLPAAARLGSLPVAFLLLRARVRVARGVALRSRGALSFHCVCHAQAAHPPRVCIQGTVQSVHAMFSQHQ